MPTRIKRISVGIFSGVVLPCVTLASAVIRVSAPSFFYLLLSLSYIAFSSPRRGRRFSHQSSGTGSSFPSSPLWRPLCCCVAAVASMIAEVVWLSSSHPPSAHGTVREAFGLVSGAENRIFVVLYWSSDVAALVSSVISIVLHVVVRPPDTTQGEPLPVQQQQQQSEDSFVEERQPIRMWRALASVLTAVTASCFAPGVLWSPYALFVVLVSGFVASSRGSGGVSRLVSRSGAPVSLYVVAHAAVTYAFQFDSVHAAWMGQASWLGLWHYGAFLAWHAWPVWVSFASALALFVVISPALAHAAAAMCCQGAGGRTRSRLRRTPSEQHGLTERLLGFAEADRRVQREGGISSARISATAKRLIALLYPHGWKLCMAALFAACFIAPGIPMFVVLLAIVVSTFLRSATAASTSPFALVVFTVLVVAQYFANVPFPGLIAARQHHGATIADMSLPGFDPQFVGLWLTYEFLVVVSIAAFIRLQTSVRHIHQQQQLSSPETAPDAQPLLVHSPASFLISSTSGVRPESPIPVPGTSAAAGAASPLPWRQKALAWIEKARLAAKRFGSLVVVFVIKFSYLLTLAGLYFACLRGSNVINFAFMIFFLVFLVSPSTAHKGWQLLVRYAQFVLLLRYIWQIHWTPETRATKIIGLEKNRSQPIVATLIWEIVVVLLSTVQLFFLRVVREQQHQAVERRGSRATMYLGKTFDMMAQEAEQDVGAMTSMAGVIETAFRQIGLVLCYTLFVVIGILMPISAVSILYMCVAFLCLILHFHLSLGRLLVRHIWILFPVWTAGVLFSCYAFQFDELHDWLVLIYREAGINDFVSLEELGLRVYRNRFVGLLPHVSLLVISTIQFRMFRQDDKPEKPFPKWISGILDFIKRATFAYTPFVLFLFAVVEFLRTLSAMHFLLLVVIMLSRLHSKGFDFAGGILLWVSQLFCIVTMGYNFSGFDASYRANRELANWIGLPRTFVPGPGERIHTENWVMLDEYLIIIALVCVQRISLRWGIEKVRDLEQFRGSPRDLPLFSILDNFASLPPQRKTAFVSALNFFASIPSLVSFQTAFLMLAICLYLRSNTILGFVYLAAAALSVHLSRRNLSRLLKPFALIVIVLVCIQYVSTLGLPDSPRPPMSDSSSEPATEHPWPWHSWAPELRSWLLLVINFPTMLVSDLLLVYFVTTSSHLPKDHEDVFAIIRISPENETFPAKPRSRPDAVRYLFIRYTAVVIIFCLFLAGTFRENAVSLVFLLASLGLLFRGDFLFTSHRPWRNLLSVTYVIIFAQEAYQLSYAIMKQFNSDRENLRSAGVVLGFDYTQFKTKMPVTTFLLTSMVMLVLSAQHAIYSGLRREFGKVREWVDGQKAREELKARQELVFQYDNAIQVMEGIFQEKKERRERLQSLRESRKRKALLWPQLADEFEDGSTIGASLSPADASEYRSKTAGAGPAETTEEPVELTKKQKVAKYLFEFRKLCLWAIDAMIFFLHGHEGRMPGNYAAIHLEQLMKESTPQPAPGEGEEEEEEEEEPTTSTPAPAPAPAPAGPVNEKGKKPEPESAPQPKPEEGYVAPTLTTTARPQEGTTEQAISGAEEGGVVSKAIVETAAPKTTRLSRATLMLMGLSHFIQSSSRSLCLIAFMANHLFYGSALSLVFVLLGFGYVILSRKPRPVPRFWTGILVYTAAIICFKFVVQTPGMCMCHGERMHYWWFDVSQIQNKTSTVCKVASCNVDSGKGAEYFSIPYLLGIVPHDGFFAAISIWDFVVLLAVLFHVYQMNMQGMWGERIQSAISEERERFMKRKKELEGEEIVAAPTTVVAIRDVAPAAHRLGFRTGDVITVLLRSKKPGAKSIGEIGGVTGLFDIADTTPQEPVPTGEYDEADEEQEEQAAAAAGEDVEKMAQKPEPIVLDATPEPAKSVIYRGAATGVQRIKRFFERLLRDSTRVGIDMYAPLFVIDFICFFFLLLFSASFTGSAGGLMEYIKQSYIPQAYIFVILFQFCMIIIDRIVYLVRSIALKLTIQYSTLVLYNALMLWYFPWQMELEEDPKSWSTPFARSRMLQVLFVLKCGYWLISGFQVNRGYPMITGERFLMRSYELIPNLVFLGYRAIPFVYELRTILDWTFTKTTLNFWDYLKVEDVYAELYCNKCNIEAENAKHRKLGSPRDLLEKLFTGCLMFLALIAVLWLPLLVVSSALPGMSGVKIIPASRVEISTEISGWMPLYTQTASTSVMLGRQLNPEEFRKLRAGKPFISNDITAVQLVVLKDYSQSVWGITDLSKQVLSRALMVEGLNLTLSTKLRMKRSSGANADVTFLHTMKLTEEHKADLARVLKQGKGASTAISDFIPRFIKMPGTTSEATSPCETEPQACTPINFTLTYHGSTESKSDLDEWWTISQIPENELFNDTSIQLVLLNTPVSSASSIVGSLAALGLIGIYTTFILAIARVIRSLTAGLAHVIMFENLPECNELLRLCKDIILARNDGDLLLEEELSNELIQIYRSPDSIIEKTRIKAKQD